MLDLRIWRVRKMGGIAAHTSWARRKSVSITQPRVWIRGDHTDRRQLPHEARQSVPPRSGDPEFRQAFVFLTAAMQIGPAFAVIYAVYYCLFSLET